MLTPTTLTGLDMPTVAEIQTVFVQAASGSYLLRADGFGIESGLAAKFKPRIMKEIDEAVAFAEKDSFPGASELLKDIY